MKQNRCGKTNITRATYNNKYKIVKFLNARRRMVVFSDVKKRRTLSQREKVVLMKDKTGVSSAGGAV